jgi:Ala-tRNA(Pro) deacylase
MPATPEDLFAYLERLAIPFQTVEHPPLFTVEESTALRGDITGGHAKNLFVKDKKSRIFILVVGEDAEVDLKRVHEKIGAQGRVSFVNAEALEAFGAINDEEGRVTVVLDAGLMAHERVNFHPLVNTMTTGLASADLVKFLRATGHEPLVMPLAANAN